VWPFGATFDKLETFSVNDNNNIAKQLQQTYFFVSGSTRTLYDGSGGVNANFDTILLGHGGQQNRQHKSRSVTRCGRCAPDASAAVVDDD
jgi:hypothetical protein